MCGRFAIYSSLQDLFKYIEYISELEQYQHRYNAAPTNLLPVYRKDSESVKLELLQWGLIPSWAKDATIGSKLINARSESANEKPSFRGAFKSRHCLIPANGFFEWRKLDRQPMFIHLPDHPIISFAGLWESWKTPDGKPIETFTILTTDANEMMREIHDRMPVILTPGEELKWLESQGDEKVSRELLKPLDSGFMSSYPVSKLVNSPRNNTPDILTQQESQLALEF